MSLLQIEPLLAVAVFVATALTDAVYVLFTNAVGAIAFQPRHGAVSGTCSQRLRSSLIPTTGSM